MSGSLRPTRYALRPARYALPLLVLALPGCQGDATAQSKPVDLQIAEAVSPLPGNLREGAAVLGYGEAGTLTTLRPGEGAMVCLADDPRREDWHVACYHRSLEPFMRRGRELRAAGAEGAAVDSIRRAEIESGDLAIPETPTALYSLTGPEGSFDPETGEASGARGLYVVYVPYATEPTTGLSTDPSRDRPWLMDPGLPWAHIMISR